MADVLDKLLAHSWQFLLIAIGVGIILYGVSLCAPHPIRLVSHILSTLVKEFLPAKDRLTIEKINVLIILVFLLLSLVFGVSEVAPDALSQAVGGSERGIPLTTLTCVGMLFIATVLSPTWIYLMRREMDVDQRVRNLFRAN